MSDPTEADTANPIIGRLAIPQMLSESGVETIFTVAGGHFLPTYHEMGQLGAPRVVAARHEQGAGYMASGYALTSKKPGVVFTGAPGPGATNVVTAVANAFADSIPLLVLTAQVDRRYVHRNILQYCDNVGLLAPFCKSSVQAVSLEEIPNLLAAGLQTAASGRPGPVHIALPQNLQAETTTQWKPPTVAAPAALAANANDITALESLLESCKRPAILAGHGVIRSQGTELLARLAERLGAPVATSRSGVGCIATTHPSSVGMSGFYGTEAAREAIRRADFVLIVGCALGEQTTSGWRDDLFGDDATTAQIDADPSQINRVYPVDQGIIADAASVLAAVGANVGNREPWFSTESAKSQDRHDPIGGIGAARFIRALKEHAPEDAVFSADIGNHRLWVCDQLDVVRPDGLLQSCEFDAMGFSLPAAIGAAVALPGNKVVAIAGDGGFVHTMGELRVARDLGIPLVVVIFADGALGILKHQAEAMYGEDHFMGLGPIDFAGVAAAMGVPARTVDSVTDIDEAVRWAMAATEPTLLSVLIDPTEVFPPLRTKIEQRKIDLSG